MERPYLYPAPPLVNDQEIKPAERDATAYSRRTVLKWLGVGVATAVDGGAVANRIASQIDNQLMDERWGQTQAGYKLDHEPAPHPSSSANQDTRSITFCTDGVGGRDEQRMANAVYDSRIFPESRIYSFTNDPSTYSLEQLIRSGLDAARNYQSHETNGVGASAGGPTNIELARAVGVTVGTMIVVSSPFRIENATFGQAVKTIGKISEITGYSGDIRGATIVNWYIKTNDAGRSTSLEVLLAAHGGKSFVDFAKDLKASGEDIFRGQDPRNIEGMALSLTGLAPRYDDAATRAIIAPGQTKLVYGRPSNVTSDRVVDVVGASDEYRDWIESYGGIYQEVQYSEYGHALAEPAIRNYAGEIAIEFDQAEAERKEANELRMRPRGQIITPTQFHRRVQDLDRI